MQKIALDLGFIQIYWYSLFIFLGALLATYFILKEAKKKKINEDFIINLIFYTIIWGIIGARLYYVLFNLDYYQTNPMEIFEIWNGGLAIHGAVITGGLFAIFYTKKYKVNTLQVFDISVVGLIIGQAIGRWGNFFNGEAHGVVTTFDNLKNLKIPEFIINGMFINGFYRVPTFLYESIWNFIGFIVLLLIRHFYKYLKIGHLSGIYLMWYSLGRIFIESMRTDSLMLGNFRVAQIVSIILFIIGLYLTFIRKNGTRLQNLYKKENEDEIRF